MTIRVFVGCSANGEDAEAQAMLEYTLRKHHPGDDLSIIWMMLSRDPISPWYSEPWKDAGWNTRGWATPFSAFRWAIPHVCDFAGRAIYMDVDQIAMADIGELASQPIPPGKAMLAKDGRTHCVILFDCAAMRPHLPPFEELRRVEGRYRSVRKSVDHVTAPFVGNWNCLDGEKYPSLDHPDIKIIHFTAVPTQPHLKYAVPRLAREGRKHWNNCAAKPHPRKDVQPLVDRLWAEAQAAGYTVDKYLPAEPFGSYDAVRGGKPARAA